MMDQFWMRVPSIMVIFKHIFKFRVNAGDQLLKRHANNMHCTQVESNYYKYVVM